MARASLGVFAVVTFGSVLALGCGRGGLGDFDGTGGPSDDAADTGIFSDSAPFDSIDFVDSGELDTSTFDSGIFVDALPIEDTVPPVDTGVPFETSVIDTGVIGTDTSVIDTGIVGFDTGVLDTIDDTSVIDTGIEDTTVIDTGIVDTGIEPDGGPVDTGILFDTGVVDTGFDAPPEGGILCGGAYCSAATQECCASAGGLSCVDKGKCSGGTALSCSSAASCSIPGQTCCLGGLLGGTPTVSCQFFCAGLRLCASSAECGGGQTCQAIFGGYKICR